MRFAVVLLSVVAVCSAVEVSQLPAAPVGCVPAVIPANTVLYHGTSVAQFALNYFNPVPAGAYNTGSANHPGGPGWFATTLGFAFHAGFRHLGANGNGYLFHYTANADIPVLNCDTHAALYGNNGFLHGSGFAPGAILNNDVTGARTFCTNIGDYLAGYIIHADRIRAQPEVIICQPDQWLNFVQRDVVAITVHAGAGGGNTHPQAAAGGTTLTFAHNAINMRLWWPPVGPNLLNDLINTATNAAILLESESKAVVRVSSTSAAHDIGAVVAKLKVKKLTKPASVKKGDPAKDVKKDENDKAVKKEENGSIAFWDKEAVDKAEAAKVKGKKFSARRLGALKPY